MNGKTEQIMKFIRLFMLISVLAVFFYSCEGTEEVGGIVITSGDTSYNVGAETTSVGEVTFTTDGPWTSKIEETTVKSGNKAAVTWVKINPSSGEAEGVYTMMITLDENVSDKSRSANIYIICGNSQKVIKVTQSGKGGGVLPPSPQPVKEIRIQENPLFRSGMDRTIKQRSGYRPMVAGLGTKAGGLVSAWLTTDAQGRVTKQESLHDGVRKTDCDFVYGTNDMIMTGYDYESGVAGVPYTITSYYDFDSEKSKILRCVSNSEGDDLSSWKYSNDNYLNEYVMHGVYEEETASSKAGNFVDVFTSYKYTWSLGIFNFLKIACDYTPLAYSDSFILEYLPAVSGISNIDLNNLLLSGSNWSTVYKMAGNVSDRLIGKVILDTKDGNRRTVSFEYEFNSNGCVSKVYSVEGNSRNLMMELVY